MGRVGTENERMKEQKVIQYLTLSHSVPLTPGTGRDAASIQGTNAHTLLAIKRDLFT